MFENPDLRDLISGTIRLMKCSLCLCTVLLWTVFFSRKIFVLQCFVCFPWKHFRGGWGATKNILKTQIHNTLNNWRVLVGCNQECGNGGECCQPEFVGTMNGLDLQLGKSPTVDGDTKRKGLCISQGKERAFLPSTFQTQEIPCSSVHIRSCVLSFFTLCSQGSKYAHTDLTVHTYIAHRDWKDATFCLTSTSKNKLRLSILDMLIVTWCNW